MYYYIPSTKTAVKVTPTGDGQERIQSLNINGEPVGLSIVMPKFDATCSLCALSYETFTELKAIHPELVNPTRFNALQQL